MQDSARPWDAHLEQTGLPWSHASLDFLQGSQAAFLKDILRVPNLPGVVKCLLIHRGREGLAERVRCGAIVGGVGSESDRSQVGVRGWISSDSPTCSRSDQVRASFF